MKMGDFKTAIIYFEKIIQLDKKLPQVYYNMGVCFNILGKNFDAIDSFKKAISLRDNYLESYIQIGQLFKKLSMLDEAIKIYKLALPKVTQKDTINVNISEVYYLQKNYQLSIKYAEDALDLNAKNYFAKINIANCLMDQGEIENGIFELEQAKVINSNSSMVFNNLGYGYKLLGNESEAIINYKKAIELNPKLHDAHFNLSHIQLAQKQISQSHTSKIEIIKRPSIAETVPIFKFLYISPFNRFCSSKCQGFFIVGNKQLPFIKICLSSSELLAIMLLIIFEKFATGKLI